MLITNGMAPDKHISRNVGETYDLLRNIIVAFAYLDEYMVKQILVSLIRSRLEYAAMI